MTTARERFVLSYLDTTCNLFARHRLAAMLDAVIEEAQAIERRRLCSDRAAYEQACVLTARELAAHGAHVTPTERSA